MKPWMKALYVSLISRCDSAAMVFEHRRALARAGDSGEHGQPPFGDLHMHVLEVVLASPVHTDQIVAVGGTQPRRLGVLHLLASGRCCTSRSSDAACLRQVTW